MPSDQNFPKRLREAAQRALAPKIENLVEEISRDLARVSESLNQLKPRFEGIEDLEFSEAQAIVEEAVSAASAESTHSKEEMLGFLAHFAHDVRSKETQEEILNLLLDGAHRFAPRVALFVTRGDQFQGWSSRGYSEDAAQRIVDWSCSKDETPLLSEALAADGLTSVNQITEEAELAEALGEEAPSPWHAFPMRAIRRPVAVLMAAPSEEQSCDLESLCILMDLTGLCIENIALKILQEMRGAVAPVAEPLEQSPEEFSPPIAEVDAEASVEEDESPVGGKQEAAEETEGETMEETAPEEVADPEASQNTVSAPPEIEKETVPAEMEEESVPVSVEGEEERTEQEPEEEIAEAATEEAEERVLKGVSSEPDAEEIQEDLTAEPGREPEEETAIEPAAEEVHTQPEAGEIPEDSKQEALPETEVDSQPEEAAEPAIEESAPQEFVAEGKTEPVDPSEPEIERIDAPLDVVQQIETAPEDPPLDAQDEIREIVASEEETPKAAILKEVEHPSEEEKLHSDAKRFARLLVSEIKLYNEKGVLEGQANGDIYSRLKRDVDRSRDMYEKRISPIVAHKADYFHDEIIRLLADNDPSKLGNGYPGPRVHSKA